MTLSWVIKVPLGREANRGKHGWHAMLHPAVLARRSNPRRGNTAQARA